MLIKRILSTSGAILAGAVLCVGCGSSGTPSTSVVANPTTVTATTTVVKTVRSTTEQTVTTTVTAGADGYPPTDFYDHGNGVYSAFETNHDVFTCDAEFNRCWGVKITAPAGCPNGIALTLTIFPVGSDTRRRHRRAVDRGRPGTAGDQHRRRGLQQAARRREVRGRGHRGELRLIRSARATGS